MLRSLASKSSRQGLALSKRCFPSTIARRGIILAANRGSIHQLNVASYQKSKFNSLELNSSSSFTRSYSHAPPLTKEIITERIIELLESYNKVKPGTEISLASSFTKDLGLDSFDTVEVIMEIEYEFSIIIPDADADSLKTVGQAVDYISQQADAC